MTNAVSALSQYAELSTIGQNIILAISGAVAAVVAICGLTTWRKELKGRSEYEKAKEVLKAVYKVRRAFAHVRGPAIFSYEYPSDMVDYHGHLKREHQYDGTLHVYETRMKQLFESFRELEDLSLDAEVEWGSEFQEAIIPLRKCRAELVVTIQDMLEALKNPESRRSLNRSERANERSVLYQIGGDSEIDKFTPEINAAVQTFEKKLRPHIKR